MSKYVQCGEWNNNYKYILLTTIFAFFTNCAFGYIFNDYMEEIKISEFKITKDKNNHMIINYIFRYLGLIFFSFILYRFDLYKKEKIFQRNNEGDILQTSSIKLIYNNTEENTKIKIIISPLFILLIMIIMVLQEISEDIFYRSNLRGFDFWILELPLLSYLNTKYFKFKIYLHHKLAIYLNVFILCIYKIIYLILVMNDNDKERKENSIFKHYTEYWGAFPLGILTYLIIITTRCFALSEIKVLMQYKYFSPIKLLIIYGIIGAIITITIGSISTFIECNKISFQVLRICKIKDDTDNTYFLENFKIWKDEINFKEIFSLLIGIIMNFFYRLFYILIIKNLTAIHIIFSFIFYTILLEWTGTLIKNNYNKNIFFIDAIILIIHLIITFGLLIYLEMIELNFCNLNYNLRKKIIDRSMQDYELQVDNEDDSSQD